MSDNGNMKVEKDFFETCAVCGQEAGDGHWFCHFYPEGEKISLCSPVCAEVYLDLPAELRFDVGARDSDLIESAAHD